MFEVRSEAHGRVLSAVEDVKSCCEISNYYEEWSDIAASSIQAFLEDLSAEQLDDTCGAFRSTFPKLPKKVLILLTVSRTCLPYTLMKCLITLETFPKMTTRTVRTRIITPIMTGKRHIL